MEKARKVYYSQLSFRNRVSYEKRFFKMEQLYIGEDVKKYLDRKKMGHQRTFATATEIFVASDWLKTDVWVYSKCGKAEKWMKYGQNEQPHLPRYYKAIYLTNTNGNHFDVVANVEKEEYCSGDFSDNNELSDSV